MHPDRMVLTMDEVTRVLYTVPANDPRDGLFCRNDLKWAENVQLHGAKRLHRLARIPKWRLDDFINGESTLGSCCFNRSAVYGDFDDDAATGEQNAKQGKVYHAKCWKYIALYTCSYAGNMPYYTYSD